MADEGAWKSGDCEGEARERARAKRAGELAVIAQRIAMLDLADAEEYAMAQELLAPLRSG